MWKNNLILASRTLKSNFGYTFLNLTGLVIGLTSCLLIVLFIGHETSFDQFHTKKDQIFRVNYDVAMSGTAVLSPSVPVFLAPTLKNQFPEIEEVTRFSSEWRPRTIRYRDIQFDEPGFCYADPSFFKIFDFKALQGDLEAALARPNGLIITQKMAKKYFGSANPIGETLNFNNKKNYEIAAVIDDIPANAHFSFNFLTSHYNIEDFAASETKIEWNNPNFATWLLLRKGSDKDALAQKIESWLNPTAESSQNDGGGSLHLPLESLNAVHFNTVASNFGNQLVITNPAYLNIFGAIAALILLIACVNYVNLTTARATARAKEVGIRKAVGAQYGQLVRQFLSESFLLLLPAMILSIGMTWVLLPLLSNLLDKKIPFRLFEVPYLASISAAWLILSVLSGFYPAFVLSKFRPISTLKGDFKQSSGGLALRKGLVVFQFAVSMILICSTIVVQNQLNFLQTTQLGMDKEQVVFVRGNVDLSPQAVPYCAKIADISGVESIAKVWRSPFETVIGNGFSLNPTPDPNDQSEWHLVGGISADEHYLQTLGIQLIGGQNFDPSKIRGDSTVNEFIVNEAFLRHYNLKMEEVIGRRSLFGNSSQRGPGTIVGVIKDFHTHSLHEKLEPIVLFNDPNYSGSSLIRIGAGQDVSKVLAQIESVWKSIVPMRPFNFTFLDAQYEAMYRTEQQMGKLMLFFSCFAVFVACLGLLGLTAFLVVQRRKEIGVRKVLGASVAGITGLLAKDFLKLVLIAIVIASPIAWYLMNKWLSDFAYRIDIQWWMFVAAGIIAMLIAFLTVSGHAVKAALADPVQSLRSE
jgi:putative ABC transport system permease protein